MPVSKSNKILGQAAATAERISAAHDTQTSRLREVPTALEGVKQLGRGLLQNLAWLETRVNDMQVIEVDDTPIAAKAAATKGAVDGVLNIDSLSAMEAKEAVDEMVGATNEAQEVVADTGNAISAYIQELTEVLGKIDRIGNIARDASVTTAAASSRAVTVQTTLVEYMEYYSS